MKNPPSLKTKIEKIKESLLPGAMIPNSRLYKRAHLIEAEAVLQFAKGQNRPVRKAYSAECEFTRERQDAKVTDLDGFLDRKESANRLGISEVKLGRFKKEGKINSVQLRGKIHFSKKELQEFERKYGPLYLID
ncbi:hypothetical protein ATE47_04000 [Chryseobacterium sp. IHB B 17019]|uniref:DNA-binding protein n=1 Tax=Chryseobacterium sp. IHB B 17019 TaxID=1721091 RepID=UPI00071F2F0B|nr:DNA-binding protein [Chryseobacterium sp. IHB B 17019]ALR29733.1 hypothetical protein ATE47_04000 [Chryseobacterium sp. IHB B 17019]